MGSCQAAIQSKTQGTVHMKSPCLKNITKPDVLVVRVFVLWLESRRDYKWTVPKSWGPLWHIHAQWTYWLRKYHGWTSSCNSFRYLVPTWPATERGQPPLSLECIPTQPLCPTLDLWSSFYHTVARKKFQNWNCLLAAAANQIKNVNIPWSRFQYRTAQRSKSVVPNDKGTGFTMSWNLVRLLDFLVL